MDVARIDTPDSPTWYYFTYSKASNGQAATTLARAQLNNNQLSQWQDLLVTQSLSDASRHFGSRIAFDTQGHVFFSIGDRAHRPNGQDLSTHAGSILRLHLDGSVPTDNPFVSNNKALPEIWSYGHRNPQGLIFDARTNRLWSNEHGPRGGDEINLVKAGANYGWPVTSTGKSTGVQLRSGKRKKKQVSFPRSRCTPLLSPRAAYFCTQDQPFQTGKEVYSVAL